MLIPCRYLITIFISTLILNFTQATQKDGKSKINKQEYGTRFKSISCESDNKTIVIKYCYLKPFSRKVVAANIGFKFLVPFDKFYIHMIFNYRYGNIFRPVMDTKPQEWCGLMHSTNMNPLIKLMFDGIKSSVPNLFHECPYTGDLDLVNITTDFSKSGDHQMFPEGTYRIVTMIIKDDIQSAKITADDEIKSPRRESFG